MSVMRNVFITVKTYPTLSKKYNELVCTVGILDDGSLVRIYPLPFRKLDYENRYKKYQWIKLPLEKNESDTRPESYKITDISTVQLMGEPVGTKDGWAERKQIIFKKNDVHSDLGALIQKAKNNELSIAIFKPTEVLDLVVEKTEREWDKDKLKILEANAKQLTLFQSKDEVKREFLIVPKLPYKFSYKLKDCKGKSSTMMIEDWEIGALFWNCRKRSNGDEDEAIGLVRKKYLEEFSRKELFLFLGTTRQFHCRARNPFVIIGVFYPPASKQNSLL